MHKPRIDSTYGKRRRIVGVMGSGVDEHLELATVAGRTIAALECHLLTGGGGGVMTSVSRAFAETPGRKGVVLGVIRAETEVLGGRERVTRSYSPLGAVNPWVEIPVFTHLPHSGEHGKAPSSRNHINVLTSDVVVALPGGPGTRSEVELALEYGWPLVFFTGAHTIDGRTPRELAGDRALARIASSAVELMAVLEAFLRL